MQRGDPEENGGVSKAEDGGQGDDEEAESDQIWIQVQWKTVEEEWFHKGRDPEGEEPEFEMILMHLPFYLMMILLDNCLKRFKPQINYKV